MASIYAEVTINRPADEVWAEVADVGGISGMLEIVSESSADGDVRKCTLANGAEIKEKILSVDPDNRRVGYTVTEGLPFEYHAASMQVFDEGDGTSRLRWITDVKPDAEAERMAPMFQADLEKYASR
ncbi:MAG: SRPBCC family protein [Thermoleophilia bacterium]|nr:SRPBCC family protein [Thermoleophilia bacterium]MDH3724474.1 SRPBCC family protein [Thermoleophilia bacterium]